MDKKELKKLLASLSIVTLIAGAGLSMTGCATAWSGEKAGAGGTEVDENTTAKEAPHKKPAGGSGWSWCNSAVALQKNLKGEAEAVSPFIIYQSPYYCWYVWQCQVEKSRPLPPVLSGRAFHMHTVGCSFFCAFQQIIKPKGGYKCGTYQFWE